MSNEQIPKNSPHTRSLIDALNSQIPGIAANEEECTVCDLIEQRLGRRSDACAPQSSETLTEQPILSSSAMQGLPYASKDHPSLLAPAQQEGYSSSRLSHEEFPQDVPWQGTIGELNAALALAMSHLDENAHAQDPIGLEQNGTARSPEANHALSDYDRLQMQVSTTHGDLSEYAPNPVESYVEHEDAPIDAAANQLQTRKRRRRRFSARDTVQFAALAVLIISLGFLPFAVSTIGELMSEAPVLAKSTERPLPELAAAIAPSPAGQPVKQIKEPAATPPARHATPIPQPKPRVEFTLERIYRGQSGQTLALPISAKLPLGPQTGAFVALRGFPAGATLSHGQGLGPSLWTVPLDSLAGLKIKLPADAPDVSLITIEAFDAQSSLLANAAFVVVAARAAEQKAFALAPAAMVPATPAPAPRLQQDVAGWSSKSDAIDNEDARTLMVSARHRQMSIERELTWSNIQPRQNLVHVSLAPVAGRPAASAETKVNTAPLHSVGHLELSNANHDPRNMRQENNAPAGKPAGVDDISHWRPYKPAPDLTRLVKRPQPATKQPLKAPAEIDEDDEPEPTRVKVKSPSSRAFREEPSASEKPSKDREIKEVPSTASSRGNKQTGGNALGGPVPRRGSPVLSPPPVKASGAATGSAGAKTRMRQELMDPSKGI